MSEKTDPQSTEDELGPMRSEEAPSAEKGAPAISGHDQTKGQTQHPAAAEDVGVPDDVGD